jgi:hypothetical protein
MAGVAAPVGGVWLTSVELAGPGRDPRRCWPAPARWLPPRCRPDRGAGEGFPQTPSGAGQHRAPTAELPAHVLPATETSPCYSSVPPSRAPGAPPRATSPCTRLYPVKPSLGPQCASPLPPHRPAPRLPRSNTVCTAHAGAAAGIIPANAPPSQRPQTTVRPCHPRAKAPLPLRLPGPGPGLPAPRPPAPLPLDPAPGSRPRRSRRAPIHSPAPRGRLTLLTLSYHTGCTSPGAVAQAGQPGLSRLPRRPQERARYDRADGFWHWVSDKPVAYERGGR